MALGIAHLLNYQLRGRTFFRVAMLMPYATSLAAATRDLRRALRPRPRAHQLAAARRVHLPAVDWQGSKWPAQIAVSTIVIWRWTGYNALIYLAGMQAISTDALRGRRDRRRRRAGSSSATSRCPGCGRRSCSRSWSRRSARPSSSASRCSTTTACADGGTSNQYQTLGLLMYQQGWTNDRLGLASATAWTMFLIIVVAVARQRAARPAARAPRGRPRRLATPPSLAVAAPEVDPRDERRRSSAVRKARG